MAQASVGTIDPTTTSGVALAALLTNAGVAQASNNSGTSRPSYLALGGLWTYSDGTTTKLNIYTSGGDITIAQWDATDGLILGAANPDTLTAGSVAGAHSVQVASGSPTQPLNGQTVTLTLVNDTDVPGNTMYYGTGPTGVKGWFAFPAVPGLAPQQAMARCCGPGTYSVTAPGNCNAALVMLTGAGSASAPGSSIMFTVSVTGGSTSTLFVGSYSKASGTGTGSYFLGGFAGPGSIFGTGNNQAAPAGASSVYTTTPALSLPNSNDHAGDVACHGGAFIMWITRNV